MTTPADAAREQFRDRTTGRFSTRRRGETTVGPGGVDLTSDPSLPRQSGSDAPAFPPLPSAAQRVVERFNRRSMSCTSESKRLTTALRRVGVHAQCLSLVDGDYGPHSVTVVETDKGHVVIDFTFDQFEPDASVPHVEALASFARHWGDYGTGFYAGFLTDSWRSR